MKRVVLFDFHNTLATCDSWLELEISTLPGMALVRLFEEGEIVSEVAPAVDEATRLFRALRKRVRDNGVEMSALDGTRAVLEQMGFKVGEAALERVVEHLEYECLGDLEIVPGAHECLRILTERGYRLGIVSSAGFPPFVERALETLGLRTYFSEVVTSAEEGLYKSDPEIFRRAVSRLDALPGEAVHIGDHAAYDVQAAHKAGLACIWFAAEAKRTALLHGANWDELLRIGSQADAVVERLEEIPAVLEGMV